MVYHSVHVGDLLLPGQRINVWVIHMYIFGFLCPCLLVCLSVPKVNNFVTEVEKGASMSYGHVSSYRKFLLYDSRVVDHVTFVYINIVQQLMVFAIFINDIWYIFQTYLNLYRSCSRKPKSDSSSRKLSNIALVFFLFMLAQKWWRIKLYLTKKIPHLVTRKVKEQQWKVI